MYRKLSNDELEIIKRVAKITLTDYEVKNDFIPVENLLVAIKDLLLEIDRLEEEKEDFEQQVEDNYRPIPISEQVGISDRDFI